MDPRHQDVQGSRIQWPFWSYGRRSVLPFPPLITTFLAYLPGLGAIFISTLAVQKLPRTAEGTDPQSQAELLAESIQPIISFVVLCSILVHGLSIPFFSLGKRVHTVSRTWSRHSAAADWTTLTRRVSKAEDIVINRDPRDMHNEMERGQVPTPATTIHEKEGITPKRGLIVTEKSATDGDQSNGSTPITSTRVSDGGEAGLNPDEPGGSVTLSEWREGPHQVIERRTGSTGEVRTPLYSLVCRFSSGILTQITFSPRSKSKFVETSTPPKTWSA
jgi:sodium/hydrogen antiporter